MKKILGVRTDLGSVGKGGAVALSVPADASQPSQANAPWIRELAEIYRAHADFVRRIAGHLGVHEAMRDDVVHDVFLVAHRRLPEFDVERGSLRSWLYGITRRVVMHRLRDDGRRARRLCAVPRPEDPSGPDEVVAQRRAAAMIEAFLASLSDERRLVFLLSDIEGMSVVEVARALECNLNTVYGRLRMARLAFATWLDQIEAGPRGDDVTR